MERDIFPFIANKYLKDSPPSSPHDANFYYDGDGNRVLSITDDGATEYIGDYYEYEVGTGITRSYCGSGLAMRVAGAPDPKKANGVFYLLKDHLGSTNLTLDSGGNLVGEMRYKAWGETRYVSGTTLTDFAYTGQRQELELGFYYYKARWYDPALGRFMQADTIVPEAGNPIALDRYGYVNNNPLKYRDPSGRCFVLAGVDFLFCMGIGALVVGAVALTTAYYAQPNSYERHSNMVDSLLEGTISSSKTGLDDRTRGAINQTASHISKLLGGESVGGFPGFEPPDDEDYRRKIQNRDYSVRDVNDWVRDINKHLKQIIKRNPNRSLEDILHDYWTRADPSLTSQEITNLTNEFIDGLKTIHSIADSQITIGVKASRVELLTELMEALGVVPW